MIASTVFYGIGPWGLQKAHATVPVPPPRLLNEQQNLPAPHLDYGIHVAPYTTADLGWVDRLQMNWVKVYTFEQAETFRSKLVLFRMDMTWPHDWEQFKRDVRARTIELVNRGVEAIEVHNEPNLSLEWSPKPDAWQYTQLLRVAYTEIKAVAPQMVVVSAGLAPTETTPDGLAISDLDFARQMFDHGAGQYFDVFGYHPYGFNSPPETVPSRGVLNFRRVELIREMMVSYGLEYKPIWLTEFGWLRDPSADGITCSDDNAAFAGFGWLRVDEQTQADYTVRAFAYADANWPWAGPMFLWNLNWSMIPAQALHICSHMRYFAILRSNGQPTTTLFSLAAMPRRPRPWSLDAILVEPEPEMTLVADAMTVETGVSCPGVVQVGTFDVVNTGKGGTFLATITPAVSISGPPVTVSTEFAEPGDRVTVYADTTGLDPGLYVIFVNIEADLLGQRVAQNLRGFVVISDSFGACSR
jgi:hypothetical protein